MLEIRVLGPLTVLRDGAPVPLPPSKKTRALLGYLAVTGQAHRRERLAALLWDVADDPRASVRWSLSKLRALLDVDGRTRVVADGEEIELALDSHEVDLRHARELIKAGLEHADVSVLEQALAVFRGELLEELDALDFHQYQAWLVAQRATARALRLQITMALVVRLHDQPARALPYLRGWVDLDRDSSEAWLGLVRGLEQAGHAQEACEQAKLGLRHMRERGRQADERLRAAAHSGASDAVSSSVPVPAPAARKAPQQIRFCRTADGVQLAYATSGQGRPIVKAGNWISHLERESESPVWNHLLDALNAIGSLVRYDQRGNGMSDWNVSRFDFEHMVADLEAVVDAAGVDRFALFGISQGCAVAIAYAVRHPERVTRLLLHGGYDIGWHHRGDESVAERRAMNELMKVGWGRDNPAFRQLFTSQFIPGANLEQMAWFNELQRISASGEGAFALQEAIGAVDVRALLPEVRVPTLVTHCRGDVAVPYALGRSLAASIPDARFVLLESNNHLVLEQEPAWHTFRRAVAEFLSEDA
jgi:pimeloyl-ACP methyl ester carboxylesterase/DNA-binding SARP family transcriptional activator